MQNEPTEPNRVGAARAADHCVTAALDKSIPPRHYSEGYGYRASAHFRNLAYHGTESRSRTRVEQAGDSPQSANRRTGRSAALHVRGGDRVLLPAHRRESTRRSNARRRAL